VSKKRPTFLKVYVIPVLLLNIALGGWSIVAAHAASISLGDAVIVTVGLYLYLVYVGRYLS